MGGLASILWFVAVALVVILAPEVILCTMLRNKRDHATRW